MIGTFIEFTWRGARNRIVQRIRRLRDPRYLIGALAGLAYLWFAFYRNTRGARARITGDLAVDFMSLVILGLMIMAWALPSDSGGLQFSEAEIAFLFPAPLRRRDLLLYKIIRAQPQALASAVAFFIFGWRRGWIIGMWLALSVLGIYFTFVALGRARLKLLHIGFVARLLIVSVLMTLLVNYAVSDIRSRVKTIRGKGRVDFSRQMAGAFETPPARAVLFVPRIFATAAAPQTPVHLAAASGGLLALGAVFFLLASRMNISFEEASIAASARRAQRIARLRDRQSGRMQVAYKRIGPLFKLAETGIPEVAIFWKNVIALMRTAIGIIIMLLAMAVLLLGVAFYGHEETSYKVVGTLFLFMAAFFPLSAPQLFANDLRLDLARSEILKSYPLRGDRLVAAELGAPLFAIAAMEVIFASCGALMMRLAGSADKLAQFVATPQFIVIVMILTLPLCAMLLVIRNAVPLYFPAWSMRAPDEARSFVNVGQRIVVLFANIFALAISLIPAAVVAIPSVWIAWKFFNGTAIFAAVATVPPAAVIVFEVWLGVKALGARFDAMDVSNEFDLVTV